MLEGMDAFAGGPNYPNALHGGYDLQTCVFNLVSGAPEPRRPPRQADSAQNTYIQMIKWAQDFLELYDPWPTQSNQIQKITAGHFKRMGASSALPKDGFLYDGHHVLQMIEAIETSPHVFVRHILRIEVLKIFGCIRTDDSVTFALKHIQIHKNLKVVTGLCL